MSMAVQALPTENEPVLTLLKQVRSHSQAAAQDRVYFSKLHESIMQLETFISSFDQDERKAQAILEHISPEMMAGLNDAYSFWETRLEQQFAHALVSGEATLPDYPLYERFDGLIKRELALVSGLRPQRVLFVGSGPLPISAIHMHLQTGLPVDCVAREFDAAAIARQAIKKCGLEGSMRVFCESDPDYNVTAYDLILIEPLAKPKKSILRTLRKRRGPGCQILCRTSSGLRQLVYQATSDHDVRGFYVKGRQVAEGAQMISTWLLEAATGAKADVHLEWLSGVDNRRASQILQLMNRTLAEETTIGFPGPIDEHTGRTLMRQLGADVEAGRRHVLVADRDGVIVGQLILTPNSTPNHRHMVELTRGTIDPSFRGAGLALLAFEEVARRCEELGRELICLDVRAGTLAAMWWQHFGFKPYGLLSDYSRVGEKRYEGLFLCQSTADLKQRVNEIKTTAANGGGAFQLAEMTNRQEMA